MQVGSQNPWCQCTASYTQGWRMSRSALRFWFPTTQLSRVLMTITALSQPSHPSFIVKNTQSHGMMEGGWQKTQQCVNS